VAVHPEVGADEVTEVGQTLVIRKKLRRKLLVEQGASGP